jgi:hypothetical protein
VSHGREAACQHLVAAASGEVIGCIHRRSTIYDEISSSKPLSGSTL